jgi:hypothetical protein
MGAGWYFIPLREHDLYAGETDEERAVAQELASGRTVFEMLNIQHRSIPEGPDQTGSAIYGDTADTRSSAPEVSVAEVERAEADLDRSVTRLEVQLAATRARRDSLTAIRHVAAEILRQQQQVESPPEETSR